VSVNFDGYPEIYEALQEQARDAVRNLGDQALFLLKGVLGGKSAAERPAPKK
jgi:hypothetical protein